jgi:hypothetical protein
VRLRFSQVRESEFPSTNSSTLEESMTRWVIEPPFGVVTVAKSGLPVQR